MPNFLKDVARYFAEKAPGRPLHEDVVYIVPNKRAAMFLKEHVHKTMLKAGRMPRLMTLRNFLTRLSGLREVPERKLMFILYDCYRRVMARRNAQKNMRTFDSFVFWGDMILSDFEEIDRSMVNASALFKNLRDVKEIQADYLNEEQKEVIRRVWGESRLTSHTDTFWLHVNPQGDDDSFADKFVYLWDILGELYIEFSQTLTDSGLAGGGVTYRRAVEAVRNMSPDKLPAHTHYAFVGFNDAGVAETLIFDKLRQLGIASFFWDTAAGAILHAISGKPLERVAALTKAFPTPYDFNLSVPEQMPVIDVYAVPSNIGQAKSAGLAIDELIDCGATNAENAINTAIILPDQNMLLPLMFSLSEKVKAVNVSMGMAYRSTTFATLLQQIVRMQLRARSVRGSFHFFYEDVTAVLNHPHIRFIDSEASDRILGEIIDNKLFNINAEDLQQKASSFGPLFRVVHNLNKIEDVANYLTDLFHWLGESCGSGTGHAARFEQRILEYFDKEVRALAELAREFQIDMADRTFLSLFERMLNHAGVPLNGTPLKGLQILGVLETRTLDFDNVIVMSMNERIFPRKQYTKTMIPNSLRYGFGLSDFESLEWTYAYCFYRLLARAKRVSLFYDSRAGKKSANEMSRYITQLEYLMPEIKLNRHTISYGACASDPETISLNKTSDVMTMVNRLRAGGNRWLSASALKTYMTCPLQFYYKYVANMRGQDDLSDSMNYAEIGMLIHGLIQKVYQSMGDKPISAADLDKVIDAGNDLIDRLAVDTVVEVKYPSYADKRDALPTEAFFQAKMAAIITRSDLEAEKKYYCSDGNTFIFKGAEVPVKKPWKISDDLSINWTMSIDRVDEFDGDKLRFIDFKTGSDRLVASNIDSLFDASSKCSGIFQLLTYCEAYLQIENPKAFVVPYIHSTRQLSSATNLQPLVINKQPIESYSDELQKEFAPKLYELISEIFDENVPFGQCADEKHCTYCHFKATCGRYASES